MQPGAAVFDLYPPDASPGFAAKADLPRPRSALGSSEQICPSRGVAQDCQGLTERVPAC